MPPLRDFDCLWQDRQVFSCPHSSLELLQKPQDTWRQYTAQVDEWRVHPTNLLIWPHRGLPKLGAFFGVIGSCATLSQDMGWEQAQHTAARYHITIQRSQRAFKFARLARRPGTWPRSSTFCCYPTFHYSVGPFLGHETLGQSVLTLITWWTPPPEVEPSLSVTTCWS